MPKILPYIKSAADLRKLGFDQLKTLAREIREEIIRVVSETGGHLASSLGAVELAIALHYCLDTPKDKLIWDVGHQAYAHKLLTGRYEQFRTLRQKGGISGFLKPHESEYDVFGAGHASTSLAAGLGVARARDLLGEDFKVVSLIGDGSMTCGLVYEALNTAGLLKTNFMVVLNDNEMSIGKNVGAIPHMFNRIITGDWYNYAKERLESLLSGLRAGPHKIGEGIVKFSHRIEESVKGLIVPGLFFEELGFRYFGPVDGHDLNLLIPALSKTVNFKGPRVLHVMTRKGKGYYYAEKDPEKFHSASQFNIKTGERKQSSRMTFTRAFGKTLVEMAEKDDRIVAITAAMSDGTGLGEFSKKFPDRFYDFGIAESAAVVTAAGMAIQGMRPVVAIYSTFLQRAFDMIIHDVALQNLPVIFALDRGGIVGQDGPTHHGTFDLSYLRIIPNITLAAPRNEEELRDILFSAFSNIKGPFALRYPRGGSGSDSIDLKRPFREIPEATGEWLIEGDKVAIIGIGTMTNHAVKAAEILKKEGIKTGVADARFVKPLDEKLIMKAARDYESIITVEDNVIAGGFGSAVNELLALRGVHKTLHSIGFPDQFVEHATPGELYEQYGMSAESIASRVRLLIKSSD